MAGFKDPFIVMRTIFLDIINYKIVKVCYVFLFMIYLLVHCLQLYYMIKNFDLNLLIKYGFMTALFSYILVVAVLGLVVEEKIRKTLKILDGVGWSLNIVGKDAEMKLEKKCKMINISVYAIMLFLIITLLVNLPVFGSQRELFISIQVIEEYFGKWSEMLNRLYFTFAIFLSYHGVRLSFACIYGILEVQLQFNIIEEYLCEIYETDSSKSWQYLQDTGYQRKTGKSLRLCIEHHVALKKVIEMMLEISVICLPFLAVVGLANLISCLTFIMNFWDTMDNILKLRIFMWAGWIVLITVLFCRSGQQLIDVTSNIFFTLGGAPWYYWNLENIKILLTFMTNCTNNDSIALAGFCLNYPQFVSIANTTISYALVLYNIRKSSDSDY
ncbi:odorant receptor 212 [Tribolium castaneum]|uniref:Odorant receptor n=1 Tax=Tribolium castaneum TaxID=7070 RepID=D6WHK9_TRICA|nr:odorant receptor 212 [Tribolium castaneum]